MEEEKKPEETAKKHKDIIIPNSGPKGPAPEYKEETTIMPTMLDESDDRTFNKIRDLSAIIPKDPYDEKVEGIKLTSKEATLKSDGSTSLATINVDGEITYSGNAALPAQIDVEARKKEQQRNKIVTKKKEKKKSNKAAQKVQNTTALGALMVIIFLAFFFYWWKNHPTDLSFTPINFDVELGSALPYRKSYYVKPGLMKSEDIDELQYTVDTSEVNIEEVGKYNFYVTHSGVRKTGIINVVDTTEPNLQVREVTIIEGRQYSADSFVLSCFDYSGCNYSFQNATVDESYTEPGTYPIYVVATDAFKNTVTKVTSLTIEPEASLKRYQKVHQFDFANSYTLTEEYEIHLIHYDTYSIISKGKHIMEFKYQNEEKYAEAARTYYGEPNYQIDDAQMRIIKTEAVNTIGSNYSRLDDIESYLIGREGFKEI